MTITGRDDVHGFRFSVFGIPASAGEPEILDL